MKTIKEIYDLLYSPIVTPYNLLDNAKLDEYSYVKYYKDKAGLVAEMKCTMDDGIEALFFYYFNAKDWLEKIYMETEGERKMVYDRSKELDNKKNQYRNEQRTSITQQTA